VSEARYKILSYLLAEGGQFNATALNHAVGPLGLSEEEYAAVITHLVSHGEVVTDNLGKLWSAAAPPPPRSRADTSRDAGAWGPAHVSQRNERAAPSGVQWPFRFTRDHVQMRSLRLLRDPLELAWGNSYWLLKDGSTNVALDNALGTRLVTCLFLHAFRIGGQPEAAH
jgi:hypothetical protein